MSRSVITVNIPIKAYLKKYLIEKSISGTEPLIFARKHIYNILLINLVSNYNSLNQIPVADKQNVIDHFSHPDQQNSVTIVLPFNERKNILYYNYLSLKNKRIFRNEVATDFYFELARYLIRNLKPESIRKELVKDYKKRYHISEDDLKLESIYRYASRILN